MVRSRTAVDNPEAENGDVAPATRRWRRPLLLRFMAIGLGLLPFLLIELVLSLLGWGDPTQLDDPFVGFQETRPLFVRSGDRYETNRSRLEFFRPESFATTKQPDEYRIFCLGGSTVQGRPYAIETSFSTFLELSLRAADPSRRWEVVNCGGVSYATYRLVLILREILEYEPDLIILYTGHNEFLEDRSYESLRETPAWLTGFHRFLSSTRTYGVVRGAYESARPERPVSRLRGEVDARLDYRGGLAQYRRDDAWKRGVLQHFEYNLDRMLALAARHEIPVVVCNPVSNLRDTPPFKFAHRSGIQESEKANFAELWDAAREPDLPVREQIQRLQAALRIDGQHAGAQFHLGKCLDAEARYGEAYKAYLRAKDEDICPLRILEPMHTVLHEAARRHESGWVDVRQLIEARSENGIPGNEWLIDHVHPSIEGHQLIARELFAQLREMGLVSPGPDFEAQRAAVYKEHVEALPAKYFSEGQRRLEGLQRWTQGRAFKVRPFQK